MRPETYNKISAVAVFAVPVAPAVFLGLRLFAQGKAEAVETFGAGAGAGVLLLLALAAGMTAAGLEFVGIVSGHVTAKLFQRKDRRWLLTAAALLAYTALGYSALAGTAGAFAFLIAPLIYLVTAVGTAADEQHQEGLRRQDEREEEEKRQAQEREAFSRQRQQQQAEFEQQLALRREEHDHRLRLAEAEQRSRVQIARAEARAKPTAPALPAPALSRVKPGSFPASKPTAPAQEPLVCAGCGYLGESLNALKGHQRWCKPYKAWKEEAEPETPSLNGNGRH